MIAFRFADLYLRTETMQQLVDIIGDWCSTANRRQGARLLGYLNPHVFNLAVANATVRRFVERCDFVCLDGIGVSAVARLQNRRHLPRVPMDRLVRAALASGKVRGTALLLGLSERENRKARAAFASFSKSVRIVDRCDGFRDNQTYEKLFREHRNVDFVLAGMGTPRSEEVLLLASQHLTHAVCWAVGGGTLKIMAGTKQFGPEILSCFGMEWMHRFAFEPSTRSRYIVGIPLYLWNVISAVLIHRSKTGPR